MPKFKEEYSLAERKNQAESSRMKHPDRIPIVCELSDRAGIANLDKKKYLVPCDFTVGQFMNVIRMRLKLPQTSALFLLIGGLSPPHAAIISKVSRFLVLYVANKLVDL